MQPKICHKHNKLESLCVLFVGSLKGKPQNRKICVAFACFGNALVSPFLSFAHLLPWGLCKCLYKGLYMCMYVWLCVCVYKPTSGRCANHLFMLAKCVSGVKHQRHVIVAIAVVHNGLAISLNNGAAQTLTGRQTEREWKRERDAEQDRARRTIVQARRACGAGCKH